MSALEHRLFSREQLPGLLDLVTANARARWPNGTYLLNSDIAWRLPGSRGSLMVWWSGDVVVRYAWFNLITPSILDIRDDADPELLDAMLEWLESMRLAQGGVEPRLLGLQSMAQWEAALDSGLPTQPSRRKVHLIEVADSRADRAQWIETQGYRSTDHFEYSLTRDLDQPIANAELPRGWNIRPTRENEIEQRVELHKRSWHRSTYNRAQYDAMRAIDIYQTELDLVAVSPSGELASYCIRWADASLRVGSFESVGTAPEWRRHGLGLAVQREGLRRMQNMGMTRARIGTASFNQRAFGLYTEGGFRLSDRLRTYEKTIGEGQG